MTRARPPAPPTAEEADRTQTVAWAEPGEKTRGGSDGDRVPTLLAGRFVLLNRLGQGGMGEVYAAYDPELDRKVAVKLVRGWRAATLGGAHVRREARALARLNHPNVVRVYDVAGSSDELAIAMELVDGQTLKRWLERAKRPWRQILEVFIAAGRGLAAAHAAGVVHRDFKPSNVMVTRTGEVRVVDFGIARGSDERGGKPLEPLSDAQTQVGTPAYLAPEHLDTAIGTAQVSDPRSDQFSFCVALYEALCDDHPFLEPGDQVASLERLRAGRLRDGKRARALPGWLEQAVLRGLRLAPGARFPSMDALLDVLERGLRRRRLALRAAAALALLLGGGFAGSLLAPVLTRDRCGGFERALAGVWDAARKKEIHGAFEATGLTLAQGAWSQVETALDHYAAEWLTMRREACTAAVSQGEPAQQVLDLRMLCLEGRLSELRVLSERFRTADREVVARASETVGSLGSLALCGPSVELSALVPLPRDRALRERLERLYVAIEEQAAWLELSAQVDAEAAESLIDEARRLGYPPLLARALALKARLLLEAGSTVEAAAAAEEALWAAVAGRDWLQQARLYSLLLEIRGFYQADHETARFWRRSVEASIAALGEQHPQVELDGRLKLGQYAALIGDSGSTIENAGRALALGERLWGADDLRLASAHNLLGLAGGAGASEHLERALAIGERHLGLENPRLAPALVNLAADEAGRGQYHAALELGLRALRVLQGFYPDGGSEVAFPEIFVAQVLTLEDRPAAAEAYLRHALEPAIATFGPEHVLVLQGYLTLSRALVLEGRLDEAHAALESAETIAHDALPGLSQDHFEVLEARGHFWLERARPELAQRVFDRALGLAEPVALPPERRSAALCGLGEAELGLGRPERAREHLEEALVLAKPGVFPLVNARIRIALARVLPQPERERARILATAALGDLPGESALTRRLRGEIDAWLAANPPISPLG